MLEESREIRIKKKRKQSILVNLCLLSLPLFAAAGAFVWYKADEQNQLAAREFLGNIKMVAKGEDIASITDVMDTYDKALDKVAVRRDQVRDATKALGLTEEQIAIIEAEADDATTFDAAMKEMMGGEGTTIADRNKAFQKKYGHLQNEEDKAADADRTAPKPAAPNAAKPNDAKIEALVIPSVPVSTKRTR